MKVCTTIKKRMRTVWNDLLVAIENISELGIDSIRHYQVRVIYDMVRQKYEAGEKLPKFKKRIKNDLRRYEEIEA